MAYMLQLYNIMLLLVKQIIFIVGKISKTNKTKQKVKILLSS